jgi:xanthine dehydrogenase accessory factor
MMDIYKEINDKLRIGQSFVLATIIETIGSSPRRVGARMLVFSDGSISGSIGGGTFEKLVIEDSLQLLNSSSRHLLKHYSFSKKGKDQTGMSCGGQARVFLEAYSHPDNLVIFGGGHIGRELARLASGSGFTITVVDDRKDILETYKPPVTTVLTDTKYKTKIPSLNKNSYVVIVTRSHNCDLPVLKKVIKQDFAYIGMIGSRAKISKVSSALKKSGISKKLLDKVHAPIGLDIGAEGPYEIAISILAELIEAKHRTIEKSE